MNAFQLILSKIQCEGDRSFFIDDENGLGQMKVMILNSFLDNQKIEIVKIIDMEELINNNDVYTYDISIKDLEKAVDLYRNKE